MCVCLYSNIWTKVWTAVQANAKCYFPLVDQLQIIFLNDYCSLLLVFKNENILLVKFLKREYDKGNIYFNHLWLIFFMLSDFHGSLINGRNNWEAWVKEGPMSSTKDNPKCVILKVNFFIIPSSALIIAVSGLIYVHHYTQFIFYFLFFFYL